MRAPTSVFYSNGELMLRVLPVHLLSTHQLVFIFSFVSRQLFFKVPRSSNSFKTKEQCSVILLPHRKTANADLVATVLCTELGRMPVIREVLRSDYVNYCRY